MFQIKRDNPANWLLEKNFLELNSEKSDEWKIQIL